ncbi:heme-binding protein [Pyrobaculum sp.]|uniref:GlcG/HbpS family heme-binding protein n=1 Tax=Pyrobaculum sp. TaxID=2004705 RepID=UPI00316304EB
MDFEAVVEAVRRGVERATAMGIKVAIVVVDGSRLPVFVYRMAGSYQFAQDVALRKAITVAYFKRASGELAERAAQNLPLYLGLTIHEGLIFGKGGLLVFKDGALVAAVGVSGGTGDQDEEVAKVVAGALQRSL